MNSLIFFSHPRPQFLNRGQGIQLANSLSEAVDMGQQNKARMVQKYIESPLIFENERYGVLAFKKFDIR
jgi:hypothetical protein